MELVALLLLLLISWKAEADGKHLNEDGGPQKIYIGTQGKGSEQLDWGERHDPTNEWAIYAPGLEDQEVEKMARRMGFEKVGQVGQLSGYYLLRRTDTHLRTRRSTSYSTLRLLKDGRVKWAARQSVIRRFKRELRVQHRRHEVRAYKEIDFNDDFWPNQWYLHDRRPSKVFPKIDLHVIPVWAQNITGSGVVVSIIDDGLEYNHTDLKDNYDPKASWDFNDKDSDPFPRYDETNENKHGTRCAGEIAMTANNKFCAVGVAFNAKVGGIRMLDGTTTDSLEAMSLSFNTDHIDIFSASWGPSDDGKSLEKPGRLAQAALEKGTREGRGGKGVIYVWASGNGGIVNDNCNCDGYTGSIYSLSISSASQRFQSPWYAEHCPSTFASTYSSGMMKEDRVISTDLHNECTTSHTGTSASAPLAAGIVALMLEANPNLTWRDVQHLVAWTSEFAPLRRNEGWQMNGAGFWVNNKFGFGLLNAAALVEAANPKSFVSVPKKHVCSFKPNKDALPAELESGNFLEISIVTEFRVFKCRPINYLEHVVLILDMDYTRRGNIEIYLRSPSGMNTQLLSIRRTDNSSSGFNQWPFSSVHNWGEDPRGKWIVTIVDSKDGKERGVVKDLTLELHGMTKVPDHVIRGGMRRSYNYDFPLPDYGDDFQQDEDTSHLNMNIRELLEGLELSKNGKIMSRN